MWKANKLVTILLWVLAGISVALTIHLFYACAGMDARIESQHQEMMSALGPMTVWVTVLLILTVAVTVLLPIPELVKNPKSALGMLGGLAALGLVVLISYLMADGSQLPFTPGHAPVSESTIIFADVNMTSCYIMLGATILTLVATGIIDFIKLR